MAYVASVCAAVPATGRRVMRGIPVDIRGVEEITADGLWSRNHRDKGPRDAPQERQVEACVRWLRLFGRRQRGINQRRHSYGYKHDVERWTRGDAPADGYEQVDRWNRTWRDDYLYISNGAFIEAARREGYRVVPQDSDSPNAFFNLDARNKYERLHDRVTAYLKSPEAAWKHRVESPRPPSLPPECVWQRHLPNIVKHNGRPYMVANVFLETSQDRIVAKMLRCYSCDGEHAFDAGPKGANLASHLGARSMPCEDDGDLLWLIPVETPASKTTADTFNEWLLDQFRRDDPVGDLAVEEIGAAAADLTTAMPPIASRSDLLRYANSSTFQDGALDALYQAFWEWSRCRAQAASGSVVYFIQGADGGPIKIGTTSDAAKRLASLQTASPVRLVILATMPGDAKLEHELHTKLAKHRVSGEWFLDTSDVRSLIVAAQASTAKQGRLGSGGKVSAAQRRALVLLANTGQALRGRLMRETNISHQDLESLDVSGLIESYEWFGTGDWSFRVTDAGRAALSATTRGK